MALLLIVVPVVLMHWARGISRLSLPSGQTSACDERTQRKQEEREEFLSYVWGISLALLLTVEPFALIYWFPGIPRFPLLLFIGVLALVQILVHFRFFLHIGFKQKREDLQLLLFSALLLTIMVAGTIWIMASLAQRMAMPT
ncbi:cytochrome C oxidase subunit IV family protein (plasmid) [Nitrobacter sp. NHB1]|uniref:cytochrome o ubiquinol oxidase subunit IV n=1 Tax=Nitrobacter sp. NHB1 TaxID=3119830 RepID=UPI003000FA07